MRISDWSSDVCSSDLHEGFNGDHDSSPRKSITRRPQKTSARAKPGQRADDHRLDTSLQGGLKDRRKTRTVIDRQFVQLARSLCLGIGIGVVADDENETCSRLPCGHAQAEIPTTQHKA